jgi:hypothetical protein
MAALRVVEALRHYAATHDGKLPDNLSRLSETPIANDPFTGKPFGYERADDGVGFRLIAPDVERPAFDEKRGQWSRGIDWQVRLKQP